VGVHLKRLFVGFVGRLVDDDIVLCARQVFVRERVKGTLNHIRPQRWPLSEGKTPNPFAVDSHLRAVIQPELLNLGYRADVLHVRGIATRTEDDGEACARIDVRRRNEGAGCIIDERGELNGHVLARKAT
jgi:hypothetical protein